MIIMKTLMISVLLLVLLAACGQSVPLADDYATSAPVEPASKASPLALGGKFSLTTVPVAALQAPYSTEWSEVS